MREIARRVFAGESLHHLALDMAARGVPAARGMQWHRSTVKWVVSSACAGLHENHRDGLPGNWAAIVGRDAQVTAKATIQSGGTPPKGRNARRHLLTGFLVCGICGVGLACNGTRYQCSPKQSKNGVRGCGGVGRKREYLDRLITDLVVKRLEELDLEAEQPVSDDATRVIAAGQAEERLIEAAGDSGDIAARWLRQLRVARQKQSEPEAEQRAALAKVKGRVTVQAGGHNAREQFESLNLSQKRAMISELFETIIVNRAGRGRRFALRDDLIVLIWRND